MTLKALTACALGLVLIAPAAHADTRADVAGFIQPTQADRLRQLERILKARGLAYEVQTFQGGKPGEPREGRNVVVTFGQGAREIVLAAHYDAEALENGTLVGGVADNAASAVAIADAAVALKARRLNHRIRIIFFDQEELGLIGSKQYLKTRKPGEIAAAVNLDVNGYGDTVIYGLPKGKDTVATLALRAVCGREALECLAFPSYPPSDDLSFTAADIPVVSIARQPARDAHQMWLLMHHGKDAGLAEGVLPSVFKVIHTPADNMDVIVPADVDAAAKLAAQVVEELDARLSR